MPTRAQRDARNTRRRELRHLHDARRHELPTMTAHEHNGTNATGLPPETYRPRGRPPIYASIQDRRDATNARRRELRRIQRTMVTSIEGVHDEPIESTLTGEDQHHIQQHPENVSTTLPTAPFVQLQYVLLPASIGQGLPPHEHNGTNATGLPPETYRPRGRPMIYASIQDRRDATNARRRELRRIQRTMVTSIEEPGRSGPVTTRLPHETPHRRGWPPIYALIQNQCDAINARRRELRRTQRTVDTSIEPTHTGADKHHIQQHPGNASATMPTAPSVQVPSILLPTSIVQGTQPSAHSSTGGKCYYDHIRLNLCRRNVNTSPVPNVEGTVSTQSLPNQLHRLGHGQTSAPHLRRSRSTIPHGLLAAIKGAE